MKFLSLEDINTQVELDDNEDCSESILDNTELSNQIQRDIQIVDNTTQAADQLTEHSEVLQKAINEDTVSDDLLITTNIAVEAICKQLNIKRKIYPALESFNDNKTSAKAALEGIGDFIIKMWDAVIEALKKIYDSIATFISNLFKSKKSQEIKIQELEQRARNLSDTSEPTNVAQERYLTDEQIDKAILNGTGISDVFNVVEFRDLNNIIRGFSSTRFNYGDIITANGEFVKKMVAEYATGPHSAADLSRDTFSGTSEFESTVDGIRYNWYTLFGEPNSLCIQGCFPETKQTDENAVKACSHYKVRVKEQRFEKRNLLPLAQEEIETAIHASKTLLKSEFMVRCNDYMNALRKEQLIFVSEIQRANPSTNPNNRYETNYEASLAKRAVMSLFEGDVKYIASLSKEIYSLINRLNTWIEKSLELYEK